MTTFQAAPESRAQSAQRIVLVDPTKFLGNLLLSGGLIQQLCLWCASHNKRLLLVLDESFAGLVEGAFPGAELVFYPRKALSPGAAKLPGLKAWWQCLAAIRRFRADLAFTIEEDSVCHRLTHFSAARYKVSSTVHRYHAGFDQVLDIPRSGRPAAEASIWFSVRDVFSRLGIPVVGEPAYLELCPPEPDAALQQRLRSLGVACDKPLLLMHAGASKTYKQWPTAHFAEVASAAIRCGVQPCLIGAGHSDQLINREVMADVASRLNQPGTAPVHQHQPVCVDLSNQLSLRELASLMKASLTGAGARMVGNDSGPSHLASALGLPGVVIFGPTDVEIWRPLAATTVVLEKKSLCADSCSRHHCEFSYRCLSQIPAALVIEHLNLTCV